MLFGGITALVSLLLSAVFSAVSWPPWADLLLDRGGVAVDAKVLGGPKVLSSRNGAPNRVRIEVRIEDGVAAGSTIRLTARPDPLLRDGARVRIEHLPDDPGIARIAGERYGIFGLAVVGPLLGAAGIGLLISAAGAISGLRDVRRAGGEDRSARRIP